MSQITTNVPIGNATRVCIHCGQNKAMHKFSLSRGKHSEDRKNFCVECEGLQKKAKKAGLTIDQMRIVLNSPCSICSDTAYKPFVDEDGRTLGVLCKTCDAFAKKAFAYKYGDMFLMASNFADTARNAPFILRENVKELVAANQTPLLDRLDES